MKRMYLGSPPPRIALSTVHVTIQSLFADGIIK